MIQKILIHNPLGYKPISWLAWIIRKATGKHYNHAGIVRIKNGRKTIIHAIGKGVIEEDYEEWFQREKRETITLPLDSLFPEAELHQRTDQQLGKKYDRVGLFKMLLFIIFGYWIADKDEYKKLMCYELVAYVEGKEDAYKALPLLMKNK